MSSELQHRKPPEVVQAQIAAYLTEQVPEDSKARVLDRLGELAAGGTEDIAAIIDSSNQDTNSWATPTPTSATVEGYNGFLRSVGGSHYESIQGRVDLLRAHERFAPAIDRLKTELASYENPKEHPAFLANGENARVFTICVDEKDYVVRIPTSAQVKPSAVDSYLAAAIPAKGIPHTEQIVAASYEDGDTVAEKIPGTQAGDLTKEDVAHVTDSQLNDLVETLIRVNQGLNIDTRPNNFLYDREAGYGIVDMSSKKEVLQTRSANQDLSYAVGASARMIEQPGFFGDKIRNKIKSVDEYAQDVELKKANLDVLNRYKAIVDTKLESDDLAGALTEIDHFIAEARRYIAMYSDPEYVAEDIAYMKELNGDGTS